MLSLFLILFGISFLRPMNKVAKHDVESLSFSEAVSWLEKEACRVISASIGGHPCHARSRQASHYRMIAGYNLVS
jgi:hypothetical protein